MKAIVASAVVSLSLLLLFSPCPASAQPGYGLLHSFTGPPDDGSEPSGRFLVTTGRIYGVTRTGGAHDKGTLFSLAPSGSDYTVWYHFGEQIMDADCPQGTLVSDGETLYGTTRVGGTFGLGTVFSFIPGASAFPLLYEFLDAPNYGANPEGGLLLEEGTLYGTASTGGADNKGVIFSIPTDFSPPNILHRFNGADGDRPVGNLVSDGTRLYGVTALGGGQPDPASGVLFSIGKDGSGFTVLHRFMGPPNDGVQPQDGLILSEGKLYGTTFMGGSVGVPPGFGTVFSINTDGTGFTVLHNIQGGNEGMAPFNGLLADGSRLYGTCIYGGRFGNSGTLFSLHNDGSGFTALHQFKGISDPLDPDGGGPLAGLATDGSKIFGTTVTGGTSNKGTVYSLDLPVQPLRLALNRITLRAGEHLTVDVTVQPIAQPFDAWAVILGTSASYSMVFGNPGSVRSGAHPFVTDIGGLASAYSGRLLDLAIPPGAAGTYRVIVGLVPAGAAPTGVGSCISGYVDQRTVTVQ